MYVYFDTGYRLLTLDCYVEQDVPAQTSGPPDSWCPPESGCCEVCGVSDESGDPIPRWLWPALRVPKDGSDGLWGAVNEQTERDAEDDAARMAEAMRIEWRAI